jgi:hypothetical protein
MSAPEFPDELSTAILKSLPLRFVKRIYCGHLNSFNSHSLRNAAAIERTAVERTLNASFAPYRCSGFEFN